MKVQLRKIAHGRSGDKGDAQIYPELGSGSLEKLINKIEPTL